MAETPAETIVRLRRDKDRLQADLAAVRLVLADTQAQLAATTTALSIATADLDTARAVIPAVIAARDGALADLNVLRGRCHELENYERIVTLCSTGDLAPLIDACADLGTFRVRAVG